MNLYTLSHKEPHLVDTKTGVLYSTYPQDVMEIIHPQLEIAKERCKAMNSNTSLSLTRVIKICMTELLTVHQVEVERQDSDVVQSLCCFINDTDTLHVGFINLY